MQQSTNPTQNNPKRLSAHRIDAHLPIKADNNPDDPIGHHRDWTRACVKSLGDNFQRNQMAPYYPDSGEYEWAGTAGGSTCHFCGACNDPRRMSGAGCEIGVGCGILGEIPRYKRKSYNAPVKDCCLTGQSVINGKTCDPKFRGDNRFNEAECIPHFLDHCANGNIFNDATCKTWDAKANVKAPVHKSKGDFCKGGTTQGNANCYNWCDAIKTDGSASAFYNQCNLDKWQQGFCALNARTISTAQGPCLDYCSTRSAFSAESDKNWCYAKRKAECEDKYYKLASDPSKAQELLSLIHI